MAHIYSGSRLCPGLRLRGSGYCFWGLIITRPIQHFRDIAPASRTYHYAPPHDTSEIRLLLLGTYHSRPAQHFRDICHYKYDIIPVSISFPHPSVS